MSSGVPAITIEYYRPIENNDFLLSPVVVAGGGNLQEADQKSVNMSRLFIQIDNHLEWSSRLNVECFVHKLTVSSNLDVEVRIRGARCDVAIDEVYFLC